VVPDQLEYLDVALSDGRVSVRRDLVGMLGDTDLAEECVQDAFVEATRRWPSAGLPPSAAGWIITTARNRALDRLRREAKRPRGTLPQSPHD